MANEQYLSGSVTRNDLNGKHGAYIGKWNSVSSPVDESGNKTSGDFECNICLDAVHDPVVTLCGHLFCWPCIYKWINFQTSSHENQPPRCPVCKTEVSLRTLVPLYGRGQSTNPSEEKSTNLGIIVPRRPSPSCTNGHTPRNHRSYLDRSATNRPYPMLNFGSQATTDGVLPGMFGEMVYARIFGNSEALYTYPNSYHLTGSNSPRLRRHLRHADQSLGRVSFFLFCCMVLCLLLF